jgi:hypothetical protein
MYGIAAGFVVNYSGRGMDERRAEIAFRLLTHPQEATVDLVQSVFFESAARRDLLGYHPRRACDPDVRPPVVVRPSRPSVMVTATRSDPADGPSPSFIPLRVPFEEAHAYSIERQLSLERGDTSRTCTPPAGPSQPPRATQLPLQGIIAQHRALQAVADAERSLGVPPDTPSLSLSDSE